MNKQTKQELIKELYKKIASTEDMLERYIEPELNENLLRLVHFYRTELAKLLRT